jgi:hypothetical protein
VEALEDRCLPASTAAASAGLLTITGDAAAPNQNIVIAQTATPGTYQVTITDDGTAAVSQSFTGITDIQINAGAGQDTISLGGNAASSSGLTGNLSINGTGQLTVNVGGTSGGFNVGGQVAITDTSPTQLLTVVVTGPATTLGALAVTGGDGGSTTTLEDGAVVNGNVAFVFGAGNDSVLLAPGATGQPGVQVNGSLAFSGGGGANSLAIVDSATGNLVIGSAGNMTLDRANVGGSVLDTFTGPTTVTLQNQTIVKGFVSINGSTTAAVKVDVADSSVNNFFSVSSGAFGGDDSITLSNSTIGSAVGIALGIGTDTLVLDNTSVSGALVTNGAGSLVLNVENGSSIHGFVSLNETNSFSSDTITVSNSTIGGFFSVVSGPASSDSISFQGVTIGSAVAFGLGAGTDTLTISRTSMGGSLLLSGQGNLLFGLTDASNVGSFVSLNETGTLSTDTITVASSNVGGFFSAVGGQAGSNSVTVNGVSVGGVFGLGLGSGTSNLAVGNLTVQGGFQVTTPGSGSFQAAGPVAVAGNQTVNLTPANALALLKALLGAANPNLVIVSTTPTPAGSTTTTSAGSSSSSSTTTTSGGNSSSNSTATTAAAGSSSSSSTTTSAAGSSSNSTTPSNSGSSGSSTTVPVPGANIFPTVFTNGMPSGLGAFFNTAF